MKCYYQIAKIMIQVDAPFEIRDNEAFSLYRIKNEKALTDMQKSNVISIEMIPEENFAIPVFDGELVFYDELNQVIQKDERCLHLFHTIFSNNCIAWNWIERGKRICIHYHSRFEDYFKNAVGCFNAAGFERILYEYQKYLFHCSYIDVKGKAVLFSAPSGGGKTTQGELWEQYMGAEMINGDRAVLEKTENGYLVHGLPIAGSSGVFTDRSLPLQAVIVVEKAKKNKVEPLLQEDAFSAILSELTLNMWNTEFFFDAMDFAMELAGTIPVYKLKCTISEEAVRSVQTVIR